MVTFEAGCGACDLGVEQAYNTLEHRSRVVFIGGVGFDRAHKTSARDDAVYITLQLRVLDEHELVKCNMAVLEQVSFENLCKEPESRCHELYVR